MVAFAKSWRREYAEDRGGSNQHRASLNVKTARLWRAILPFTHLAREGRMTVTIGRRELLVALGGAAGAWPLAARAQQRRVPMIGALHAASHAGTTHLMAAYFEGLKSEGYVEGQNVMVEYRWADGVLDRIPEMMTQLVRLQPDVIMVFGTATRAAYNARLAGTAGNIPLVFALGHDPVASGLVTSLNRPDNNITGVTSLAGALAGKRAEFVRELVPKASKLAFLINPTIDISQLEVEHRDIEAAARALGWQLLLVHADSVPEFESAFVTMVRERVGALVIATDTFFYSEMGRLGSLAARHAIPAVGPLRDFPAAGGMMSYSTSIPNTYRQAGVYTAKVLKGAKPADLPFLLPTRFELVINLNAAKALGVTVPAMLLATADEVIE
jgi:putative tryptophan/tyrosine transport system substrate-binding protein